MAEHHILGESVVEHSKAGTDHRFALASDVPRHADTRGEVFLVRVIQAAQSRLPYLRQSECPGARGWRHAGDVAEQIVLFLHDTELVPAEAAVESQPRGCAEAVLDIQAEIVLRGVAIGVSEILETAVH